MKTRMRTMGRTGRRRAIPAFAGMLAIVLAMTMAVGSASALNADNTNVPAEVGITKVFDSNPKVAGSFKYDWTAVTVNGIVDAAQPAIPQQSIDYAAGYTEPKQFLGSGLADVAWPHAGEYVYTVVENQTASTMNGANAAAAGEHKTYSQAAYEVHVYVKNNADGTLSVYEVGVFKTKNDDGSAVDPALKVDASQTGAGFLFKNQYYKDTTLTVTKAITDEYGDKTKDFTFTPTFQLPASAIGHVTTATATVGTTNYTITFDPTTGVGTMAPTTFTLHHGQTFTATGLPDGTTYTVSEAGVASYTGSYVITTGGTAAAKVDGTQGADLATGNQVTSAAGDGTNTAAFSNAYKTVSPTGILIQNAPFILIVLIASAGVVVFLVSRRHRNARS